MQFTIQLRCATEITVASGAAGLSGLEHLANKITANPGIRKLAFLCVNITDFSPQLDSLNKHTVFIDCWWCTQHLKKEMWHGKKARIIHQSLFQPCQSLISEFKERIYMSLAEKLDVTGLIHPPHPQLPPHLQSGLCFGLGEWVQVAAYEWH